MSFPRPTTLYLSVAELNGFSDYSCSLPTGQTVGKRWKCNVRKNAGRFRWRVGEYGEPFPEGHEFHGDIPIYWYDVVIEGRGCCCGHGNHRDLVCAQCPEHRQVVA